LPNWHDDEEDDYDEEEDDGVEFGTPASSSSKPMTAQSSMASTKQESMNEPAARDGGNDSNVGTAA